jgi:hypothetical protein
MGSPNTLRTFSAVAWFTASLASTLSGCRGSSEISLSTTTDVAAVPRTTSAKESPTATAAPSAASERAFTPSNQTLALLPFAARLNKVAAVVDLPPEDALFDSLRALRFELGDHDYAQGVSIDLRWSARRMATWVQGIRPICDSARMRQEFPDFSTTLDKFTARAHAREVSAEDQLEVEALLNDPALPDGSRYRTICIALLSSAEFVSQ